MKTAVFVKPVNGDGSSSLPAWYFLADSALINAGKPFFIPEGGFVVNVYPCLAFKITRLGKTVKPRFASRYYTEVAPAFHFRLDSLFHTLLENRLPVDPAVSFDRSLSLGNFIPLENIGEGEWSVLKNAESMGSLIWSHDSAGEALCRLSEMNTLKTGDVFIPSLGGPFSLSPGDRFDIKFNNEIILSSRIK